MESVTEKDIKNRNFYFLQEGGEMGELTRNFDWAETSLGAPDTWPNSLQTTIGIILHSSFPMFLFWGDELLCFYNDAYRPSLGKDGKHPAVGKEAAVVWPEIWDFIHPLIQKVQTTGKSVWFEDQFLPIYRNGRMEDVYWTFSYSPVFDDSGKIGGVFVTCVESTKSVQAKAKLQESEKRFQHFVRDATVGIVVIMGDKMIVEIVNEAYAALIGRTTDELVGNELFKIIPETEEHFKEMIDRVRTTGNSIYLYDHPYMVYVNGVEKRGYVNVVYQPYKEDDGTITGVMALCHDVTEQVISTGKVKEREEQVRSIIEAAPFPIGIYIGKEMQIEFVNQAILDTWKKERDIIGKTFLEVLPEMKDTPFPGQLDKVFITGEAFHARNQLVNFMEDGKLQPHYFNYSYTPLFDGNGKVYGVMNTAAEVTDLEIAKQQIQESELQIRNMIIQAPVAMCLLMGDDHTIDVANDLMIELWGKPKEQVMGKPVWDALPDAREQGLEELMQTVYKKGETFKASEMPVQLLRNGKQESVYQNFVYEPYRSPDGKILGVLAITIDVTTQVMARKRTEANEERIRSIIEATPFPIGIYTGEEMIIEFANKSIMDVWGKGHDVVGKKYTEILPELENQKIFDQVREVYRTGVPFHARNERVDLVVDNKLQPYYFNYSFTPVYDSEGVIYGVMNTAAETTDINIAKQQLEASAKSLRSTILQAPVAMCIYKGSDFVIDIANKKMLEFWGVDSQQVMGKPVFEAMPNINDQGFEKILNDLRETGQPFNASEMQATLMRDGKPQPVYINFALEPIREIDESTSAIFATAIDVTEQVLARQKIEEVVAERTRELASTNQELQRSNAELGQFAYIASHDLQEPIRKVSTFAQMLEHSLGEIDDRSKGYLTKINRSTERMIGLIRDVLSYSQLTKENNKDFREVDLSDTLDAIKSDYELLIEQKEAEITYKNLPVLNAIPLQMSQLFSNLISNALKFSRVGVKPVISIDAQLLSKAESKLLHTSGAGDLFYKITVQDNGIGFEQDHSQQIFNIFQRLHGRTEYSGTGIGLAICKKIAENHNGEIFATSTKGEGTCFTIILPKTP